MNVLIIAGITALSFLAIGNIGMVIALVLERRRSEKRIDDLLNRVMAKDFDNYTANSRHLKNTENMGEGQTAEQYLKKFNSIDEVLVDLESRGFVNHNTVPVV